LQAIQSSPIDFKWFFSMAGTLARLNETKRREPMKFLNVYVAECDLSDLQNKLDRIISLSADQEYERDDRPNNTCSDGAESPDVFDKGHITGGDEVVADVES